MVSGDSDVVLEIFISLVRCSRLTVDGGEVSASVSGVQAQSKHDVREFR